MGLVSLCKLGEVPSQEPEGLPANPVGRRRSPALCWKRGVLHTLIKTGKEGRRSKEWCRRWRGWVRGGSKSAWCRRTGRPKPCPLSCSCCSQFSRPGPQSVPLQLSARWQCGGRPHSGLGGVQLPARCHGGAHTAHQRPDPAACRGACDQHSPTAGRHLVRACRRPKEALR